MKTLPTMLAILAPSAALAECRPVDGKFIFAADLAAASPVFAAAPPTAVFAFAPRPGVERIATAEQLKRFAGSYGIDNRFEPLCFVRTAAPPDPGAITAAMHAALANAESKIEILEISRFGVPPGTMVFPRESLIEPASGDVAVWHGYVSYDGGRFPVWAKARIHVPVTRVVAVSSLRQGQLVGEGDVMVETVEEFPHRAPALLSPEDAVGRAMRRSLAAGAPLTAAMLAQPNAVERGQTVAVEVRSGGAVLKLEAKAEAAGHRGDTIPLRGENGRLFRARVEDKGRATLDFGPQVTR